MQEIIFCTQKALVLTMEDIIALDSPRTSEAHEYLERRLNPQHLKEDGYTRVFLLSNIPKRNIPKSIAALLQRTYTIYTGDLSEIASSESERMDQK